MPPVNQTGTAMVMPFEPSKSRRLTTIGRPMMMAAVRTHWTARAMPHQSRLKPDLRLPTMSLCAPGARGSMEAPQEAQRAPRPEGLFLAPHEGQFTGDEGFASAMRSGAG